MGAVDFPNLRQLRTFEAVARLQSLGRAATELNRSQPGITQTIAKIEADFDVALMERRHSGTYLTPAGRILYQRTERFFVQLNEALDGGEAESAQSNAARLGAVIAKITASQVRCLIALSSRNSVDAAAAIAQISAASLVRNLRDLEHILGRRMIRNSAQGFGLTLQAAECARRLRLAATEIEFAREEIAVVQGETMPRVTIGALPQCATTMLVRAIEAFLKLQPTARVTIEHKPYDPLFDDLRSGAIDFLFGVLRKPKWAADIQEEALLATPYAITLRRDHPLTRKRKVRIEDLTGYDWILPRPGTPRRVAFDQLFANTASKPTCSIETNAIDIQVTMIASSDRITIMSAGEIKRVSSGGSVVALDFIPPVRRDREGVATRRNWQPTPGKQLFLNLLREQCRLASHKFNATALNPT